jgi:uncharacterized protein (TIRG00374 family)
VSRLKVLVGVAVSAALLGALLWSVDLPELVAQLRRTRWGWVALGVALGLLGVYARAARWRYLFPPRSHPPALAPAMMIGYMANNVLPLRAGEFVRVYVVARRWGHGFWTALATLVVERLLDSLSLVLILAVLVLLIDVPAMFEWAAFVLLAIDAVGVLALGFLAVRPVQGRRVIAWLGRRWPKLRTRALHVYERFVHGLDGIRTPAHLLPLAAWTVVIWILPALAAWVMLFAVDIRLPWLAGWTVMAFVGLGISVPAAPGYLGVFHAAAALAVGLFDVSPAAGLGYAIVFHASQFVPVTVVGWLYLLREHVSLSDAARSRPPLEEAGEATDVSLR